MSESASISTSISDGDRFIEIRREPLTRRLLPGVGHVPQLDLTITDSALIPKELFVHQRQKPDYIGDLTSVDEFCFVAQPADVGLYPVDAPPDDYFPAFFRKDRLVMLVPGIADALEAYESIVEALRELLAEYKRLESLYDLGEQLLSSGSSTLTLRREQSVMPPSALAGQSVRLRISATKTGATTAHIFGHLPRVLDATEHTTTDEFAFITSSEDSDVYPINEPDMTIDPPFFRKSFCDIIVPTPQHAEDVWQAVLLQAATFLEIQRLKASGHASEVVTTTLD